MPNSKKIDEFLKKLAPCIQNRNLADCVDESIQLSQEMGISAHELIDLSAQVGIEGAHSYAYVFALTAGYYLEGIDKEIAFFNAGLSAKFLGDFKKAEEHYKEAINANPNYAEAHSNYANLLVELGRNLEAEEHYKEAIKSNPNYAKAHSNYAVLLRELGRKLEAEEHYKEAIKSNPNYAEAHSNYAVLLVELGRNVEAEEHYKEAIKSNPHLAGAHTNYANLLNRKDRNEEAEEHYKEAIKSNPYYAVAHGAYGLLLIKEDNRIKEALEETEIAYNIFEQEGNAIFSHLAKAWFYQKYSEKLVNQKKYRESSDTANTAGEEFLSAAESAEGNIRELLFQQGNIQKAKSFVRKIPKKTWYKKIYYRLGKNSDISELIGNFKNAAGHYEKASFCLIGEQQDVCEACHNSVTVFSEILGAMNCYINGDNAKIDRKKWDNSLDAAGEIYEKKDLKNGIALVKTLKQLTNCVDELANYHVNRLPVQKEKLGRCYNNLIEVSENLQGSLKVISDFTENAISDYAKKQGMNLVGETGNESKTNRISKWLLKAAIFVISTILLGIIASIIANRLFELGLDLKLLNFIKSYLP